jgi:hypothetical protein
MLYTIEDSQDAVGCPLAQLAAHQIMLHQVQQTLPQGM